jgi:hypothetical protein
MLGDKIKCIECGVDILRVTFERNNGLCMPCKNGIRKQMEENARRRKEEEDDPIRIHWWTLTQRVNKTDNGFNKLEENEKLYYAVQLLDIELYNGGFEQYFFNSSSNYYFYAEKGLIELGAIRSRELLRKAKNIYFPIIKFPVERDKRITAIHKFDENENRAKELGAIVEALGDQYCSDQDNLNKRLKEFAIKHKFVNDA